MGDQLTPDELARVRTLLRTGSSSVTNTNVTNIIGGGGITFLTAPFRFYAGTGNGAWVTYSAVDAGVPAGSTAIVIQAQWWILGRSQVIRRSAHLRIDSSKGNGDPDTDTFLLCAGFGMNDNNSDIGSGSQQGTYPLRADGSFDYLSAISPYGWTQIVLDVVGYVPAPAA
jgi:hypothetical protein